MKNIKKIFSFLLFGIFMLGFGQSHNGSFYSVSLKVPLAKKIKIDGKFQHKRQNGFDNKSFFDKNSQFKYTLTATYKLNKEFKFYLSPFGYTSSYKLIEKEKHEKAKPSSDYRFSVAARYRPKLTKGLHLKWKTTGEYQIFESEKDIFRLKSKVGLEYKIAKRLHLEVYDRLSLNLSGVPSENTFRENRVGAELNYGVTKNLTLGAGYIYNDRKKNHSDVNYTQNILAFSAGYSL